MSKGIDDILSRGDDPRRAKTQGPSKFGGAGYPDNSLRSIHAQDGASRLPGEHSLNTEDLNKYRVSKDFYRQNEVIMKQIPLEEKFMFDKSLDLFFRKFCKILLDEVSSGPIKRDINSYVDHYGKENKGYINYSEFKEIY